MELRYIRNIRTTKKALFIVLILLVTIPPLPLAIGDPGWLTGWDYRKSHTITGSVAGAQTDYQLRFQVEYGTGADAGAVVYLNGSCESDFGDIRFTKADGETLLDYWIQQKTNDDVAYIWVEVDSIPASPDTVIIYIYYGKTGESTTSSFSDTWIESDDFSGNPTIVRDDTGGTYSASNWDITDRALINHRFDFDVYIYESNLHTYGSLASVGFKWGTSSLDPTDSVRLMDDTDLVQGDYYMLWFEGSTGYHIDTGVAWVEDEWHVYSLKFDAEYKLDIWRKSTETFVVQDDAEGYDAENVTHMGVNWYSDGAGSVVYDAGNDWIHAQPRRGTSGYVYFYIDNFRVGNYCDPEPAHTSWGSEEEPPALETPAYLFGSGFNASSPYVSLYWTSNLTGITLFEVQNSTDKVSWDTLGSNTTAEYHDFQVVNGAERYYKVRACNYTDPVWDNSSFTDINFETVYFVEAAEAVEGDTIIMGGSGIFWIILIIMVPIVAYMVNKK